MTHDDDTEAMRDFTRELFGHEPDEETPPPPEPTEGNVAPREGHNTTPPSDPMTRLVAALFRSDVD